MELYETKQEEEREAIVEQLRDFLVRTNRVLGRRLGPVGSSLAQLKLLIFLDRDGPIRSIDVMSGLGLAPRTATQAIDLLERDGLVRRDPDPDDRRAKRISVTDAGRDVIQACDPVRREFFRQLFAELDAAERSVFKRTLWRLSERLKRMDEEK